MKIVSRELGKGIKRVKKKRKKRPSVFGSSMGSQTLFQLSRYADDKEKREKTAVRVVLNPLAIMER